MAITYLSGERIQGSSSATEQLDYETVRDDSNDASSLDLTGSTISDSSWVLRFKLKPTTVTQTSSSDSVPLLIGISSLPSSSHHSSSHDFLGIQPRITGSYSNYYVMAVDGGTLDTVPSEVFSHALQAETIYVEMIRNGNTFSVEFFSDEYSTSVESETKSCTGIASLRYFWIGNMNIGAGATPPHINIGEIHDLKFYNGVTSASGTPTTSDDFSSDNMVDQDTAKIGVGATSAVDEKATISNVQIGTRFEETDTRKIFHRRLQSGGAGGNVWAEKGVVLAAAQRGLLGGGADGGNTNVIDYITIQTTGNTTDFGDLSLARQAPGACADATRGCWAGGNDSVVNVIDYATVATLGNATDFGDLILARKETAGCASSTRGVFFGGDTQPGQTTTIDYITIQSTGNSTDFGDLYEELTSQGACADATRGIAAGGHSGGDTVTNSINYVTIASTGNSTDFGNLTNLRYLPGACADATRGVIAGGDPYGPALNIIDYITIASTGNATDFGDLTQARTGSTGLADSTRGVFCGGAIAVRYDIMDYITIQTTGNAIDFGDMSAAMLARGGLAA